MKLLLASILLVCAPAATAPLAKQHVGSNIPVVSCPTGSTMDQDCLRDKTATLIRTVNSLNQELTNKMVDLAAVATAMIANCNGDATCEQNVNDAYVTLALQHTNDHTRRVKIAEDTFVAGVLRDCCKEN